ncbi:MAG: hypothetical protein ACK5LP_05375 [Campylobacteraceae bacterium]
MLKTEEILELENKYKNYKSKNKFLYIIPIFISIVIIFILFFLFKNEKKIIPLQANFIQNISNTTNIIETLSNDTIIQNNQNLSTDKPIVQPTENTLTIKVVVEPENRLLSHQQPPVSEKIALTKDEKKTETVQKTNNAILIKNNQTNIDSISIETNNVKSLSTLIDRFEKTNNIVFAIMISEEYYENNNFENSLKWALIANELDSKNEQSWIQFAKSKVKLGRSDEAIHALQVFTQYSKNSNLASALLKNIQNGNFK